MEGELTSLVSHFAGEQAVQFEALELERAYYHCSKCGHGFFPRDQALHIGNGSLSEGVLRMIGTTASLVSFAETEELLRTLSGVQVEAKQVERASEALGREIDADERAVIDPDIPTSITMYLGIDASTVSELCVRLKGCTMWH